MIEQRLAALREVMRRERLGAFIFPSTDPHGSEYVADHWKGREWISGFDGSAGTAVVTLTSAALWTDSRYFIQAAEQLKGTDFQLMRLKVEGTPSVSEWIIGQLSCSGDSKASPSGGRLEGAYTEIGIDGMVSPAADVEQLIADMRRAAITVRTNLDPLAQIWTNRPPVPINPITVHPLSLAGEPAHEKLARIRKALRQQHADGMLVCALDDIAWTLNLRGSDVHCNPVFISYLLISSTSATLFVHRGKLSAEVVAYLKGEGVTVDDYQNVQKGLKDYFEYNILLDPHEVNYMLYRAATREIVRGTSPIPVMKAIKNEAEIAGFHNAMLRDGIAMVKFLMWLKPAVAQGGQTEISIDEKLTALRAEQDGYRGLSFDTIAAYGPHGAIVHYTAQDQEPTPIPGDGGGFLLLDSGAQYLDGTTDITRTIALGPVSDEERRVYTLVLKGHLALQNLKFPDGAAGTQLDAIARQPMWEAGMNFLHGTGHGVGAYLCVHEGPHQIRMEWKPTPLHAGMTVTDEPGIYLEGRFGVRIENTLLVVPCMETEFGRFLQFEPLTLCPIDTAPLMPELLTEQECQWLNNYHALVFDRLAPHLNDEEETAWLRDATKPV